MMQAVGFILFPLAGVTALGVIVTTTARYWDRAQTALSALFRGSAL